MSEIQGTDGNDTLDGTPDPDTLYGGDGDDVIIAGDGTDALYGGAGNDVLQGGLGSDLMDGGAGDDTYYYDSTRDTIVENANNGRDTLYAYINYVLPAGTSVEVLSAASYTGTNALNLTGNDLDQTIYGNNGGNRLEGGDGNDVLVGLGGADVLVGGAGADTMIGGEGRNTYYVDSPNDVVVQQAGAASVGSAEGIVYTYVDFNLTRGAVVSTFSAASYGDTTPLYLGGNEYSQTIYGNAGSNVIASGGGRDTLIGFGGDDTYYVDSDDVVLDSAGEDRILSYTSYSLLYGGIEVLASAYAIGVGQAVDLNLTSNGVREIYGTDGRNTLTGGTYMFGFAGDDTYFVDRAEQRVVDSGGRDTVRVSVSYHTDSEIEVLLTSSWNSTASIDLLGFGAQEIYGNEGSNLLWGGVTMAGMGGADVYRIASYNGLTSLPPTNILGFLVDVDRIEIDDALFPALSPGRLQDGQFRLGTAAQDANDRILYDLATGHLFYDADGAGGVDPVLFATVYERIDGGHPLLVAGDFTVI